MAAYDQFELNSLTTYSGSYTDVISYGNLNSNDSSTNRSVIATKTTGIVSSSFYIKDIGRSDAFGYINGDFIAGKTQNGNSKIFSANETIFNSLPPSPIGIMNTNGTQIPYLQTTSSWKQVFSSSLVSSPKLNRPSLSENSAHCILKGNGVNSGHNSNDGFGTFVEHNWQFQFPFQSKFKGLKQYFGSGIDSINIERDIYSGSLQSPISTKTLGSLFYSYQDHDTSKRYVQYSQIWLGIGGPKVENTAHKHINTKSYNALQKVYYSNFSAVTGNPSSSYVAFGECGTILTSSTGISDSWKTVCSHHQAPGLVHDNPYNLPIEIASWPPSQLLDTGYLTPLYTSATGSIRDAIAIGYSGSLNGIGSHLQWLLIVEAIDSNGNRRGKLVRTANITKSGAHKIPERSDWEYIDLDLKLTLDYQATVDQFGYLDIDLHSFDTKNPRGEILECTAPDFVQPIIIVGKFDLYNSDLTKTTSQGLIIQGGCVADDPYGGIAVCTADTFCAQRLEEAGNHGAFTDTVAYASDVVWFSTTCGKHDDRPPPEFHYPDPSNLTCGVSYATVSATGSGCIIKSDNYATIIPTTVYQNIDLTNIWANPVDVPPLYSIAYGHQSASFAWGAFSTTICVGARGTILRCTSDPTGSGNWTLIPTSGSYSGTFVDVKKIYDLDPGNGMTTADWIVIGDDGEIQYSANDGVTFKKVHLDSQGIDYPNRISGSSGLGSVLTTDINTLGSGSKNVYYTSHNRTNSFRSYYAGSLEKTLLHPTEQDDIVSPLYTVAVGGVSTHDFNEGQYAPPPFTLSNDRLLCRIGDVSGSNHQKHNNFIDQYILPGNPTSSFASFIKPTDYDYHKAFFGYGDGFSLDLTEYQYGGVLNVGRKGKTPNFLDWSPYDIYGHVDVGQFNLYNPQLRGWKYGLYSGINSNTFATWRRNRFGQFRDMLEQRQYTRLLTTYFGDSDSKQSSNKIQKNYTNDIGPVKVSFVPDTLIYDQSKDYVSATNPDYNPYDSGIYDIYYRSGQPFFDRDNED